MSAHHLEAARIYLRIRMRKEMTARPDLLPAIAAALEAVESTISRQRVPAPTVSRPAKPLLTARSVPDTVFGDHRATEWAGAYLPTLQMTLRGAL